MGFGWGSGLFAGLFAGLVWGLCSGLKGLAGGLAFFFPPPLVADAFRDPWWRGRGGDGACLRACLMCLGIQHNTTLGLIDTANMNLHP